MFVNLETITVACAVAAATAAVFAPNRRTALAVLSATLLWIALASLAARLLTDDFAVRYVWLYSGPNLPWYLKLANVWGGDEGTLLFLAALLAAFASALCRRTPWAAGGMLAFAAAFGFGTLVWNPFVPTPPAELAALPYRGMNAHLMVIWMALHPPALFVAYALLMAPAGAAVGALLGRPAEFERVSARWFRLGWLMLTTGIAFGMWWAFEDFTFGQAWHWDPVQTGVFATWCLATAALHGLRRHRAGSVYDALLPLLSLLVVAAVFVSMAITRVEVLQSSHRYVGDTSAPLFVLLAVVVTMVASAAAFRARRSRRRPRLSRLDRWVLVAIALFTVIAFAALIHLGYAFAAAWLGWARPDDTKPFFEMLLRWSTSGELAGLRRVFASWDVDGFSLNRALAPMGVLMAIVGGHVFATLTNHRRAALFSLVAAAIALGVPWAWQPMDALFTGTGMTSQKTVAMFYWLDALLLAAGYFFAAATTWLIARFRRAVAAGRLPFVLPVALVHAGAMTALVAIVFASVLDHYLQAEVDYPAALTRPQSIAEGFTITIASEHTERAPDGGRRAADDAGFRAVRTVSLALNDEDGTTIRGETLYRDTRPAASGLGSVRELCRILDYRYARYVDDGASRLDPFIYRGWWRDIQVWIPPGGFEDRDGATIPNSDEFLVVIRIYPLMSWLWIGLVAVVVSALVLTYDAFRYTSRRIRS